MWGGTRDYLRAVPVRCDRVASGPPLGVTASARELRRFGIQWRHVAVGSGVLRFGRGADCRSVWQTYSDTSKVVSEEAISLAALYRDVSSYPDAIRPEMQQELSLRHLT